MRKTIAILSVIWAVVWCGIFLVWGLVVALVVNAMDPRNALALGQDWVAMFQSYWALGGLVIGPLAMLVLALNMRRPGWWIDAFAFAISAFGVVGVTLVFVHPLDIWLLDLPLVGDAREATRLWGGYVGPWAQLNWLRCACCAAALGVLVWGRWTP
ncbi:MAG: anthrone oxygenase family protein [Pseudomonadota bacterium]